MNQIINDRHTEPMYDEGQLEAIQEQENADLIVKLLLYAKSLEEQVVALRSEVNRLTPQDESAPYEDLHSDLYESFDDHPAYERYSDIIDLYFTS